MRATAKPKRQQATAQPTKAASEQRAACHAEWRHARERGEQRRQPMIIAPDESDGEADVTADDDSADDNSESSERHATMQLTAGTPLKSGRRARVRQEQRAGGWERIMTASTHEPAQPARQQL